MSTSSKRFELSPFQFESRAVRVQMEGLEPWFNANDVCEVLAYANPRDAVLNHVDAEDVAKRDTLTPGGVQRISHVNESGLYALILGSAKPEAKRFKKWVTSEVLPSIRKTGGYRSATPLRVTTEAARAFPPLFRAARLLGCDRNAAAISANQYVRKLTGVNLLEGLGAIHLPAENQSVMFFTPTELGKMMGGFSAQRVNLLLAGAGLQAKAGEYWRPLEPGKDFARLFDTGKRHGDGTPVLQVKWSEAVLPLLRKEDVA